jgi:hypothetical protein
MIARVFEDDVAPAEALGDAARELEAIIARDAAAVAKSTAEGQ